MEQLARGLLDPLDGFLRRATHVIHDRDPLYTAAWKGLLASRGVKSVPIPAKSPNCNAVTERFIRTVREECLDHFVIVGERHLRHLLKQFVAHYHAERYHQGLDGRIIRPTALAANDKPGAGWSAGSGSAACSTTTVGGQRDGDEFSDTTGSIERQHRGQDRQEAIGGGRDARLGRRIAVGGKLGQRSDGPAAGEEDFVTDVSRDGGAPARLVARCTPHRRSW